MNNINIEKISELLKQLPSPGDTSLDSQIQYAHIMSQIILTPQLVAIYNSLKELKGIKARDIERMKEPKVSDNFQIGPEGAHEYGDWDICSADPWIEDYELG